jgi:hypothetical protein
VSYLGRRFGLSDVPGGGVSCNENGVFVGAVPLLARGLGYGPSEPDRWRPRPVSELNRDLSKSYHGLPVDFNPKIDALGAVARALDRGDLIHAQIATLHLEIPDPPLLTKSAQSPSEIIDLARRLRASGLLKADWDPAKHPRWPAGSPGSVGGEFAPTGAASDGSAAKEPSPPVIPAQLTIPVPFELPGGIPFPSEILPPPVIPDIYPRELRNPYPDRAGCDEEWAEAIAYCKGLLERNQLGRGDYRGSGKSLYQCIMGQVSERCGGNSTGA